jgi:hypothetical protein
LPGAFDELLEVGDVPRSASNDLAWVSRIPARRALADLRNRHLARQ